MIIKKRKKLIYLDKKKRELRLPFFELDTKLVEEDDDIVIYCQMNNKKSNKRLKHGINVSIILKNERTVHHLEEVNKEIHRNITKENPYNKKIHYSKRYAEILRDICLNSKNINQKTIKEFKEINKRISEAIREKMIADIKNWEGYYFSESKKEGKVERLRRKEDYYINDNEEVEYKTKDKIKSFNKYYFLLKTQEKKEYIVSRETNEVIFKCKDLDIMCNKEDEIKLIDDEKVILKIGSKEILFDIKNKIRTEEYIQIRKKNNYFIGLKVNETVIYDLFLNEIKRLDKGYNNLTNIESEELIYWEDYNSGEITIFDLDTMEFKCNIKEVKRLKVLENPRYSIIEKRDGTYYSLYKYGYILKKIEIEEKESKISDDIRNVIKENDDLVYYESKNKEIRHLYKGEEINDKRFMRYIKYGFKEDRSIFFDMI